MSVTIQLSLIVFLAALVAGGLGVLAHTIFGSWLKAPGWVCLWAALTVALFCMAVIKVSP